MAFPPRDMDVEDSKADRAMDKKMGIKEGSKRDTKFDKDPQKKMPFRKF